LATLLLVGATGCSGSSSDGGSEGAAQTTQADSSDSGSDSSDDASGDLPDPCQLVTLDQASEILGGESAPADDMDSDPSTGLRACSWQTQAGIDDPTLDGAGHVLTLTVLSPMGGMSSEEFFAASKESATDEAEVDGCDEAYWQGGQLAVIKGEVILSGAAGLADVSEDAKASTIDLVEAACASL